jgi:hypothetical protein
LEHAAINQEEVVRAEWLWNRRPKVQCANLIFFFFYIIVLVCLIYSVPQSAVLLFVWMAAGASYVFVDGVRLDRWRKEYASSIKRLILPLLKHWKRKMGDNVLRNTAVH